MFWQQLLRWLVSNTPGRVVGSASSLMLLDDGHIRLLADVRDEAYNPAPGAQVQAHLMGPEGISTMVDMTPVPDKPGSFQADWTAEKPGTYVAQITAAQDGKELGEDVVNFQRMDGVAENFHAEQNRDLLQRLAAQTGGRYWRPQELSKLADQIPYSEAGITMSETKQLWNLPIVFLAIIALRATELLLRRRWGIV
jgi:hypothetical protein